MSEQRRININRGGLPERSSLDVRSDLTATEIVRLASEQRYATSWDATELHVGMRQSSDEHLQKQMDTLWFFPYGQKTVRTKKVEDQPWGRRITQDLSGINFYHYVCYRLDHDYIPCLYVMAREANKRGRLDVIYRGAQHYVGVDIRNLEFSQMGAEFKDMYNFDEQSYANFETCESLTRLINQLSGAFT